MKKRKFSLPLILGASLILLSLSLLLIFQLQAYFGSVESQKAVAKINELLPERTQGVPGIYPNSVMPVLEIDRVDYVAILEIPAFGVNLPVADKWDNKALYSAPSRFSGSAYDNTLVIGGADSSQQFSFCDKIDIGATVTVTDMTGATFSYAVTRVDRSKNAESNWLVSPDYALTLFCRDVYSMEYIAVRCITPPGKGA